jgi:hypothetical protein
LPFALSRARKLLLRAQRNPQIGPEGAIAARVEFDLGLIYLIQKRADLARAHLEKARAIAEHLDSPAMLAKVDAALAKLA